MWKKKLSKKVSLTLLTESVLAATVIEKLYWKIKILLVWQILSYHFEEMHGFLVKTIDELMKNTYSLWSDHDWNEMIFLIIYQKLSNILQTTHIFCFIRLETSTIIRLKDIRLCPAKRNFPKESHHLPYEKRPIKLGLTERLFIHIYKIVHVQAGLLLKPIRQKHTHYS